MTNKPKSKQSGCGVLSEPLQNGMRMKAKRVVIGGNREILDRASLRLRKLGVDIITTANVEDVTDVTLSQEPSAVMLSVEASGESGFLTCAKLRLLRPKLRIVLVGEATPQSEQLARFVGARFATETDAADMVMKLI